MHRHIFICMNSSSTIMLRCNVLKTRSCVAVACMHCMRGLVYRDRRATFPNSCGIPVRHGNDSTCHFHHVALGPPCVVLVSVSRYDSGAAWLQYICFIYLSYQQDHATLSMHETFSNVAVSASGLGAVLILCMCQCLLTQRKKRSEAHTSPFALYCRDDDRRACGAANGAVYSSACKTKKKVSHWQISLACSRLHYSCTQRGLRP